MTYRVANRDVFEALSADLGLAPDYTSERVAGRKSLYRIDASKVRHALRLYRSSDLPRLLETWRREDNELTNPRGAGPKQIFSDEVVLTLLLVLARDGRPMYLSTLADLFVDGGITDNAIDVLGLTDKATLIRGLSKRKDRQEQKRAWYDPLWYTSKTVRNLIDPFWDIPRQHRLVKAEFDQRAGGHDGIISQRALRLIAQRDGETFTEALNRRREVHRVRALEFGNALVRASHLEVSDELWQTWDGSISLDATPIRAPGRPNPRNAPEHMHRKMGSNFEAGWYNKEKIVNGVDVTKRLWAYEATLAVAVGGGFSGEGAVPGLIMGMSFEKPHVRPGTIGIEALRWLMDDPDVPKGYLLSDRAYVPQPKAKDFQLPVRWAGYKIVADQRSDQSGIQYVDPSGATLVDGKFHCPLVRYLEHGIDPRGDLRDGEIDDDQFERVIEQRRLLELRPKGGIDQNGNQKMMCPAKGSGAHVVCPFVKRRHVNDPNGWPVDHLVAKARKAKDPIVDNQPRCCTNVSSVTVPVRIPVEQAQDSTDPLTRAMKFVQDGPSIYTKEWNEVYGRRNSVESVNGTLKGPLGAFIDDPRTRLMRGWASQFFLAAFAVAGTNHRLIVSSAKDDVFDRGPDPKRPEPPKLRRFVSEYEDDDSDLDFYKNRRTRGPDLVPGVA